MIWDFTDPIFKWDFWKYFKWIFGLLILVGLLYIIWILNVEGEGGVISILQNGKLFLHL